MVMKHKHKWFPMRTREKFTVVDWVCFCGEIRTVKIKKLSVEKKQKAQ